MPRVQMAEGLHHPCPDVPSRRGVQGIGGATGVIWCLVRVTGASQRPAGGHTDLRRRASCINTCEHMK